jgi:16S rRNA (guanine966-N2)-methyltransferase
MFADRAPGQLRIIGGSMRGRKLQYSGRFATRPMKDRLREAIFNLVGPSIKGLHAIDLFAGTGAIGLEAISRGAVSATLIELHIPTAKVIEQNVAALGIDPQAEVVASSAFMWVRELPPPMPSAPAWAIFCSPPYDFFVEKEESMLKLISALMNQSPAGSLLVVEADERFDFNLLPEAGTEAWRVRSYPPAVVGIWRKESL